VHLDADESLSAPRPAMTVHDLLKDFHPYPLNVSASVDSKTARRPV
jgi:hypothetical protein